MKRRIATWAVVALSVFSLTACGGGPTPTPETPSTEPTAAETTPVEEETTPTAESAEQSLADACLEPNKKLVEASAELAKVNAALASGDTKDAQAVADAFIGLGKVYGTMAEGTSNPEVKQALEGISEAYTKFGKLYPKAATGKDMSALTEAMTVLNDLVISVEDFQELCTP